MFRMDELNLTESFDQLDEFNRFGIQLRGPALESAPPGLDVDLFDSEEDDLVSGAGSEIRAAKKRDDDDDDDDEDDDSDDEDDELDSDEDDDFDDDFDDEDGGDDFFEDEAIEDEED